ncbi:hypothetical protein MHK_002736, partial [Candidatus Magnetomorum sp. HK-1]
MTPLPLPGKASNTRPTLGFIIAAAQWADQTALLYRLIDFTWWINDSTSQDQEAEQLERLSRDQHNWGIIRTDIPGGAFPKSRTLLFGVFFFLV